MSRNALDSQLEQPDAKRPMTESRSPVAHQARPAIANQAEKPRLVVEGLNIYYGAVRVIHNVSLAINSKKVTAIIGPSGCGKSTFIRCLNRMHEVTPGGRAEGKVLLDGEDLYGPDVDPVQVRRCIGMVFQKPNPFPTMSISDNVVAGFKLHGHNNQANLDRKSVV